MPRKGHDMRAKVLIIICAAAAVLYSFATAAQSSNPYGGNAGAVAAGAEIFVKNCQVCHGAGGKGDICPNLTTTSKKYGNADADLFLTISKGRPGGMPSWENSLGADRIWKVITYIRSIEKK